MNIGRFELEVQRTTDMAGIPTYDVLLLRDGNLVKAHMGCIGTGAHTYWLPQLTQFATRLEHLYAALDMANHNLMCYSTNLSMEEAKDGYELEWVKARAEGQMLEAWITEMEGRI